MNRVVFRSVCWVLISSAGAAFGQAGKASLEGLVFDGATRQPIAGASVQAVGAGGQVAQSKTTANDGSFQLSLNNKESYQVVIQAKGYLNNEERLSFSSTRTNRLFGKNYYLTKVISPNSSGAPAVARLPPPPKQQAAPPPANKQPVVTPAPVAATPKPTAAPTAESIQIQPILFAQSTPDVLPESQGALDSVLRFLLDNPATVIELAGHTDNQGDFDQNVVLSRQRADVVKSYLLGKGIAPNRLRTRGYGGTRPAATNNYETTRPINRRVEVTVLKE